MNFRQLLTRNLFFFWRTNLAVVLGVIAATAVIAGALIVGDSVRDSLVQMSKARLGDIDDAVLGGRFFTEQLAEKFQSAAIRNVAPAIILTGTVETAHSSSETRRAGQIQVYGLDERAWNLLNHGDLSLPEPGSVILNERVASQLGVETGGTISLIVEIPSSIPRDALLGEREEMVTELSLKVTGIAPDALGLARLGMNPTQQLPSNIYVSLSELQSSMGLNAVARSRRNPVPKPSRVNTLLISTGEADNSREADQLTESFKLDVSLEDLGLRIIQNEKHGYVSLESEQMFLDEPIAQTALASAEKLALNHSPVFVYLANELRNAQLPQQYSMYSVIAGIDPVESAPFGPFEFLGPHQPLTGDHVYLNEWLAQDLSITVGDDLSVTYHVVGDRGDLPEEEKQFTVAGIVALRGSADDSGFTPEVPGVTDAETYADWREPFPLKRDKITDRDDDYWSEYRTTPKVFISLEQSQKLWQSRYGKLTSLRLAPHADESLNELSSRFEREFLSQLDLVKLGLGVQPVKAQGIKAAQGTTDFTGLFIGFSFFLILSAAMLIGLLFRLGVEQRLREIGLLSAIGLTPRFIRRLFLMEGLLLVLCGGILGLAAAVGYAAIMIHGLKTWWYGAIGTKFLDLSVHPQSLLTGFLIAVIIALIAVWWGLRQSVNQSTRSLLSGSTSDIAVRRSGLMSRLLAATGLGGSLACLLLSLTGMIPETEAFGGFSWRIVLFFLMGIGMLAGSLAAFSLLLSSTGALRVAGRGGSGEARLGFKNAARNRSRSVLTASLIASATFVIVAVAAGQMNPVGDTPRAQSGNGGFTLVAQTSLPILYDINTSAGRGKLGFDLQNAEQMQLLDRARVFPFRLRPGENASCLNLYQTQLPTVLGVPNDVLELLVNEDRFVFADTRAEHPWELIREDLPEARIPVLGDMNTLMYSLHKGIGATINVPDDSTPEATLQVAGMFANSVFQGVLVMSEENFLKLFPDQAGFRYFLIDVPPADAEAVANLLESRLGDFGFDADRVSDRLANFLSVQNTYLSTFQTLGGLGLLLGTIGLATVMLRNVLERAGEFALLRAIGFRNGQVAGLVAWENLLLLGGGLFCGTVSALVAMSPHLSSSVANVPWGSLLSFLIVVFVTGMLAALVAVRAAVQTPILKTLRGE